MIEQTEIDWGKELEQQSEEQAKHCLSVYCENVDELTIDIERKQKEIEELKKQQEDILIHKLPVLFDELGLSEIVTNSGKRIYIDTFFNPKIINETDFFNFLKETGEEAIIKHSFSTDLPMDSEENAKVIRDFFKESRINYNEKEKIHAGTLKKWVKLIYEAGEEDKLPDSIQPNKFIRATIK